MDNASHKPPAALKVSEVARQLGLSVRQVYYLIEAQELPAIRHPSRLGNGPGAVTVEQAEVDRYKRDHRTVAVPSA